MTLEDKIGEIEEEIKNTKYNKATQHHIGRLKAKLAQLREESLKRGSGGGGVGFGVRKHGDATVVLVGFPSVGKSTLLNRLTNAESPVAAYDFTTLEVIPGMMDYRNVRVQILDLPGIITGASLGRGRGRKALSIVRNADLVLIMVDSQKPAEQLNRIADELQRVGIRLDLKKPNVRIRKMSRGGIRVTPTVELKRINTMTVASVLNAYSIHNAEVTIHEDIDEDQLIDVVSGNRAYIPSLLAVNKIDLIRGKEAGELGRRLGRNLIGISASMDLNLDALREGIYRKLDLMKIYLKRQGAKADFDEPLVVKRGSTVEDVCNRLHTSFRDSFLYAKVWGTSAKYPGQRKGLEHVLDEGDVVNIIKEK